MAETDAAVAGVTIPWRMRRGSCRVAAASVVATTVALAAGSASASRLGPSGALVHGEWRGVVVLTSVSTGYQAPLDQGNGGWNFNRKWTMTWRFNAPAPSSDPYDVASGRATFAYSRDDVGVPRAPDAGGCSDEARASGSLNVSFREMLTLDGSTQTPGRRFVDFHFERLSLGTGDKYNQHDVTHEYACGLPPTVYPETLELPRRFRVTDRGFAGGLAITKKLIRGRTVIKTNCTNPNPPRVRNECSTWKPYGGWWKQNFTITINLTHTRIGGRGGGEG